MQLWLIWQVCLEVTEMNCDVEAYTDCTMSMEEVPYKSYDMVMGTYNSKTCTESTEIVQHTKTAPDCRYTYSVFWSKFRKVP